MIDLAGYDALGIGNHEFDFLARGGDEYPFATGLSGQVTAAAYSPAGHGRITCVTSDAAQACPQRDSSRRGSARVRRQRPARLRCASCQRHLVVSR